MAEVAIPRELFASILDKISQLRLSPGTGSVNGTLKNSEAVKSQVEARLVVRERADS
jgi:hypothetical protein